MLQHNAGTLLTQIHRQPFQLWSTLEWVTIPGTVIVAYIFFGFLVNGDEIEGPSNPMPILMPIQPTNLTSAHRSVRVRQERPQHGPLRAQHHREGAESADCAPSAGYSVLGVCAGERHGGRGAGRAGNGGRRAGDVGA